MTDVYLTTPITEEQVRNLKLGDSLYITGTVFLMRDEAHERALEWAKEGKKLPLDIEGLALYHCGPIVQKKEDEWEVISAGPTTSTRMELFEDHFIETYKIAVVIGKGGMGDRTIKAMKEHGAVFGAFTGGAGVLAAKAIKKVSGAHWLDLGTPEAFWVFEVERFGPLTVAIDANGNSLYKNVAGKVKEGKEKAYAHIGIK
ncbi:MAG: FumA C-terminus/TtdB family hydratase beta subunit [Promethearchaeota archaeon]